jgi:hypothetical protein
MIYGRECLLFGIIGIDMNFHITIKIHNVTIEHLHLLSQSGHDTVPLLMGWMI